MHKAMRRPVAKSVPARLLRIAVCFAAALASAQDQPPSRGANSAALADAKQTYESVCAACHGLDGKGSERGPDIASRPEAVRKSDTELMQILTNGKPASGMPSFSSFGERKVAAMVAYLRVLQGQSKELRLPGDPDKGRLLFFGKANCSECHSIGGQGGFFAQDLAAYGGKLDPDELRAKITNPDRDFDPRRGLVHVVLPDGTGLTGALRNENNFSLQIQTPDGVFHLLNKSELRSQSYVGESGMPRDYETRLTPAELNDVVSFVLRSVSERLKQSANSRIHEED
jgi:putative heme-binding domain-containing protein